MAKANQGFLVLSVLAFLVLVALWKRSRRPRAGEGEGAPGD